jgi:hypothetical protein
VPPSARPLREVATFDGPGQSNAKEESNLYAGQRLRQFYDALALGEQPVPDRFIEIINRLDGVKGEKQQS